MNYAKIKHFDIANGDGVRISLFVSGCNFKCKDCFNSEAWDFNYGNKYTEETKNELIKLLSNANINGLSLLGGDPLWQDDDGIHQLIDLVDETHKLGKNVWIWSGFRYEQLSGIRLELINKCDVFVDGLFDITKKDLRLKYKGSSNQRVIDIKKTIENNQIILFSN